MSQPGSQPNSRAQERSTQITRLWYTMPPPPAPLGKQRSKWNGVGWEGSWRRQTWSPKGSALFVLAEGFYREQRNGPDKKMACVDRKEGCVASTSAQKRI